MGHAICARVLIPALVLIHWPPQHDPVTRVAQPIVQVKQTQIGRGISNCCGNGNCKRTTLKRALPTWRGREFNHVIVFALNLLLVLDKKHAITEVVQDEGIVLTPLELPHRFGKILDKRPDLHF